MHIAVKSHAANHVDHMNGNCKPISDETGPNDQSMDQSNGDNNDDPVDNKGGRLKFFKDGKMILELTQAKFGEKLSWIKVTNGTFWPPHGLVTAIMRHENCTSDDNSSLQSSPWQRDHSWKQIRPKKCPNSMKNREFFYKKPQNKKSHRWLLNCSKKKMSRNACHEIFVLKSNTCKQCKVHVSDCGTNKCNTHLSSLSTNGASKSLDPILRKLMFRFHSQAVIHKNICSGGELLSPSANTLSRKRNLKDYDKVLLSDETNGNGVSVTTVNISCINGTTYQPPLSKKRARCAGTKLVPISNKTEEKTLPKSTNYSILSLLSKKDSNESVQGHDKHNRNVSTTTLSPSSLSSSPTSSSSSTSVPVPVSVSVSVSASTSLPTLTSAPASTTAASAPLPTTKTEPIAYYPEYSLLQSYLLTNPNPTPPIAHQYNGQIYLNARNRPDLFYAHHNNSFTFKHGFNFNHTHRSLPLSSGSQMHINDTNPLSSDVPLNLSKHAG